MAHPRRDGLGPQRDNNLTSPARRAAGTNRVSSSISGVRRLTSDESWIEVSSQPSSSSMSSATNDEVITSGLRVTQSMNARRRRRLHRSNTEGLPGRLRASSAAGSSQDEYYESENESDRIMASSNEDNRAEFQRRDEYSHERNFALMPSSTSSDARSTTSDDDENATALGVPDPSPFTPQPNAFTHPPSSRTASSANRDSYFARSNSYNRTSQATSTPPTSQSSGRQSHPRAHTRTRSHTPYNLISPNHSVPIDHDAALRASLSTLLSCAAAARGLPKRDNTQSSSSYSTAPPLPSRPPVSNRIDQGTLRLIPESSLDATASSTAPPLPRRPSQRSSSSDSRKRAKRKSKSPSLDGRKRRRAGTVSNGDELGAITPTLMTWVVGAGVVVLFSAISFSAGYALGKEVGRVETVGAGALGCGAAEADTGFGRGLRGRAWRWGNGSGVRA